MNRISVLAILICALRGIGVRYGMARIAIIVMTLMFGAAGAYAACPPAAAGTTPEAIELNRQRVLCLQQDLSSETTRRKLEMDLKAMERSIQDLQLQRRLDSIPQFTPVQPPLLPDPSRYSL